MNFFNYFEISNDMDELIPWVVVIVIAVVAILDLMHRATKRINRHLSVSHTVNDAIEERRALNSREVFVAVNTFYYDAILEKLTHSLTRAGYKLSESANVESLLPHPVFEKIAQEVDKTRQEYMTSLHYDTSVIVSSNMKDGYAQRFLSDLIRSCSQLGWKIVPTDKTPEGECVNLYSALP